MAQAPSVPVSGSKLDNRRVLAALIDLAVVGAGWALILAAAGLFGDSTSEIGAPLSAVGLGWALYYYFACESGGGQTLGKRVMKIRVVDVDGAPAGIREVALRTVLRVVDGLFFYLIGLIVMLATKERRGRLGDLVGGTMIVSADEPAPAVAPVRLDAAPEAPRVPIAESGPAFEPVAEQEPAVEEEPDVASPSLVELASDVTAVTEDPEREVEDEEDEEPPVAAEEQPAVDAEVEVAEEPAADENGSSEPDEPAEADEDEPEADAEPEEEVTVKSVETVSAIDLVMDGDDEEAVAAPQAKARRR